MIKENYYCNGYFIIPFLAHQSADYDKTDVWSRYHWYQSTKYVRKAFNDSVVINYTNANDWHDYTNNKKKCRHSSSSWFANI
jgi:hypothetical protein